MCHTIGHSAAEHPKFRGYLFRSRLEARWAVFFDALGIQWEYEPEGIVLSDGTHYLPDFYLPDFHCLTVTDFCNGSITFRSSTESFSLYFKETMEIRKIIVRSLPTSARIWTKK